MYEIVCCINDDEVFATNHSDRALAPTLRLAWELIGGIPSAEVTVRRGDHVVAWLLTDWRGNLASVEVYSRRAPGQCLVTPLNPSGPLFRNVFA
jgi:hypothetical protein